MSSERDISIYPLVNIGPRPGVIGRESFAIAYSPSRWAKFFALSHDDLEYLLGCEAELFRRTSPAQVRGSSGEDQ